MAVNTSLCFMRGMFTPVSFDVAQTARLNKYGDGLGMNVAYVAVGF
jgi:hypothetical protein